MEKELCVLSALKDGRCYPLSALLDLPEGCNLESGTCFSMNVGLVDSHGHPVDEDTEEALPCKHDAPALKKVHKSKERPMSDTLDISPLPVELEPDPPSVFPAPVSEPQAHITVPSSPDTALAEVKALIPAGGDAGAATVLLAAIGVAGGGAAWKFYNAHSKRKHDEKMKELELKHERAEQRDNNHEKCSAERLALEAKVSALETRLNDAERKSSGIELPFDVDDLKERLAKLEKAAKARKATRAR